eukprot:jgi/Ulvmu1/5181/UM021_0198.1
MAFDGFETVMGCASEYMQAMQDLQAELKQGWFSISKTRYSVDPTQLSRCAMRAADADGLQVRVDCDGRYVADWEGTDRPVTAAGTQLPEIKKDFRAAVQAALKAVSALENLQHALNQLPVESEA